MREPLKFFKMHGLGNDFVVLDCMDGRGMDFVSQARKLCDRHCGVGADGLIAILPSVVADCRMRIFNADGSEAQMCGNGIRCAGKFVHDFGYVSTLSPAVETMSGVKTLKLSLGADGKVTDVEVDMGVAVVREEAPAYGMIALSVGNPHIVSFVGDVMKYPVESEGPKLECHPVWPDKANVEFVQLCPDGVLLQRTWERGVGETEACGTGACAAAVAAVHAGLASFPLVVKLLGGDLHIDRDEKSGHVLMTGPATLVFEGRLIPDDGTSSESL